MPNRQSVPRGFGVEGGHALGDLYWRPAQRRPERYGRGPVTRNASAVLSKHWSVRHRCRCDAPARRNGFARWAYGLDFLRGFIVAKRDRDGALAQVRDHVVVVQGGKFEARLTSGGSPMTRQISRPAAGFRYRRLPRRDGPVDGRCLARGPDDPCAAVLVSLRGTVGRPATRWIGPQRNRAENPGEGGDEKQAAEWPSMIAPGSGDQRITHTPTCEGRRRDGIICRDVTGQAGSRVSAADRSRRRHICRRPSNTAPGRKPSGTLAVLLHHALPRYCQPRPPCPGPNPCDRAG